MPKNEPLSKLFNRVCAAVVEPPEMCCDDRSDCLCAPEMLAHRIDIPGYPLSIRPDCCHGRGGDPTGYPLLLPVCDGTFEQCRECALCREQIAKLEAERAAAAEQRERERAELHKVVAMLRAELPRNAAVLAEIREQQKQRSNGG